MVSNKVISACICLLIPLSLFLLLNYFWDFSREGPQSNSPKKDSNLKPKFNHPLGSQTQIENVNGTESVGFPGPCPGDTCWCSGDSCYCCRPGLYCTISKQYCCPVPGCGECGRYCLPPDYKCCENYVCAPETPKCCGEENCCAENAICCGNEECCDEENQECCKDGEDKQFCCAKGGCCGSQCCRKGYRCCTSPNEEGGTKKSCVRKPELEEVNINSPELSTLPPPVGTTFRVVAVPVGQGDCTILQCPNGNIVMVDCGSSGGGGANAQDVNDYLGLQRSNIVAVIITHPDMDHSNYLPDIVEVTSTPKVASIIYGGPKNSYRTIIQDWFKTFPKDVVQPVNNENKCGYDGNQCTTPKGLNFCGGTVTFSIVAANFGGSSNQNSIVLKATHIAWSILLPGDVSGAAETKLALLPVESDCYKMAHHGSSNNANRLPFLTAVNPFVALVSNGYDFGNLRHPRCLAIENLENVPGGRLGNLNPPERLECGNQGKGAGLTDLSPYCKQIHATFPYELAGKIYYCYISVESNGTPGTGSISKNYQSLIKSEIVDSSMREEL